MPHLCPCGTDKQYSDCCEPFHKQLTLPQTAEQLMRSRYAAFVLDLVDYLLDTSTPTLRKSLNSEELSAWSKENQWEQLQIISKTLGGTAHDRGEVEFKAYYTSKSGKACVQHERSIFEKTAGKWYYVTGKMDPKPENEIEKTNRNAPCPCGSGLKFKRCCA